MLITFDTIKKAEESNKSYEPGRYNVKIKNAENKVSERTGNEYLRVTFETMGEDVFEVKNNYFFTEKSVSIFLNLLSSIGLYDKDSCSSDLRFEKEDLLGNTLSIELVLGEENENGKRYLTVKPWTCEPLTDTEEIPF